MDGKDLKLRTRTESKKYTHTWPTWAEKPPKILTTPPISPEYPPISPDYLTIGFFLATNRAILLIPTDRPTYPIDLTMNHEPTGRPTDHPAKTIIMSSRLTDRPTGRSPDKWISRSPDIPISRSPAQWRESRSLSRHPTDRPTDRQIDRLTDQPTNRPTDLEAYRVACMRLKSEWAFTEEQVSGNERPAV